jgi:hypothetical protein
MSDVVTSDELRAALTEALRRLAPAGGSREIGFNTACDAMVAVMADLLVAAGRGPDDVAGLAVLFRERLEAALVFGDVAGHA